MQLPAVKETAQINPEEEPTSIDPLEAFHRSHVSPRNWPGRRKWTAISVLAAMTFVTCLAPAIFAPAISQTMHDFHQDPGSKLASIVIAIYVLGWASGPLIVSPMSELYGRLWVYHVCNVLFVAFSAGCAASTSPSMLVTFRFLAGCSASAVLNIGGGTVADLFTSDTRGLAMTIWTIGALLGPISGPVLGGFLARSHGWRSTLWLTTVAGAITTVLFFIVMRETYAPILLQRQLNIDPKMSQKAHFKSRTFTAAIRRPFCMLVFSPVVLSSSVYIALVFGYQYVLITTLPGILRDRDGFSTATTGLGYLGLGSGMLISLAVFGLSSDRLMQTMAKNSSRGARPEHRLLPLLVATPLVPAGIFLYGWSAQLYAPWIATLIGTALLGAGLNATLMSLQTYLIDAFSLHAASVMAASTILRSLCGALLPLAAPGLFEELGLGWGCSVLGFIAIIFIPLPVILIRYGRDLRSKYPVDS
ncbi:Hypothetical protein R9X50_00276200 [Acrodontium crateriforme]|uniref:Major facilitator superfamily (MFS) profile domain-containing protein n=1 Tax=Acrodontium crateriforme TaxID=150365 RepID=A0AAQ3R9B7_9PEZI|nr:Hypothetical protein R9X50_00276200 [Acrodontium crateriforme]